MSAARPGPTDAQRRAAETLDRHLAVTAGPGSGKTRVLVSRYLHVIEAGGVELERIVAITFTNKAASEMRERVRGQFDARIAANKGTNFEHLWRERKRRLEGAVITTIHGFCSRLLRENPVEAIVDPQFTTLDDYTQSVMLDGAAQAAVTGLINDGDETAARLVASFGRGTLVRQFVETYKKLRNLGISVADAEGATLAGLSDASAYRARLAELEAIAGRIGQARPGGAAKAQVETFLDALDAARPALAEEPESSRVLGFLDAVERVRNASPEARATALKPLVEVLRQVIGQRNTSATGSLAAAFFDACAREFAPHVFGTLRTLDALYTFEKRSASALDYEDLQLRVRDLLRDNPEVVRRVRGRYRFFLVDEFQDTNGLQRDIIDALALGEPKANLFIVGDRKQSIYGFRGAEVEVFSQAIRRLEGEGGLAIPLDANFRSRAGLVAAFNAVFERLMQPEPSDVAMEIESLGFVAHEAITTGDAPGEEPLVELLLDLPVEREDGRAAPPKDADDDGVRDREARRLAARIRALVLGGERVVRDRSTGAEPGAMRPAQYGDIAVLLRAITDVKAYERAFRQQGIPFYVVAGKGFYDRPEVVDLLNLVAFLDNHTDELALAAVLRSPLFGVSDETLLALRAERLERMARGGARGADTLLFDAVRAHASAGLISPAQHEALGRALVTLDALLALRNRLSISELLFETLRLTEYETVAAASEDGAQRLSNIDKLLSLARGFERTGTRLLRDFVEFVREFRRLDAREAEALLRTHDDAVAVLTVHKSKGLEFPVVVLPDLQREFPKISGDVLFDRALGLAFKVPDGRGGLAKTGLYEAIAERRKTRERFEAMRLLYVAMTRAEDYLILSGASGRRIGAPARGEAKALRDRGSWLAWLLELTGLGAIEGDQRLELGGAAFRAIGPDVVFEVAPPEPDETEEAPDDAQPEDEVDPFETAERVRRALGRVAPVDEPSARRFGATELQSYATCPRKFFYARLLRIPTAEGRVEPATRDSVLSAPLRGLVLHKFCETLGGGEDVDGALRRSLHEVLAARGDEYPDLVEAAGNEKAIEQLRPYARNYTGSRMRKRVDERLAAADRTPDGRHELVRSELPFMLRTRGGFVVGAIDKVLVTPLSGGRARAYVIDFKTGYVGRGDDLAEAVAREAEEFTLQMQIYAHAVRRLVPGVTVVEAALHFLQPGPDAEYHLPAEVIGEQRASEAIDRVLSAIHEGGLDPAQFGARPGRRCRTCSFARFCPDAAPATDT